MHERSSKCTFLGSVQHVAIAPNSFSAPRAADSPSAFAPPFALAPKRPLLLPASSSSMPAPNSSHLLLLLLAAHLALMLSPMCLLLVSHLPCLAPGLLIRLNSSPAPPRGG